MPRHYKLLLRAFLSAVRGRETYVMLLGRFRSKMQPNPVWSSAVLAYHGFVVYVFMWVVFLSYMHHVCFFCINCVCGRAWLFAQDSSSEHDRTRETTHSQDAQDTSHWRPEQQKNFNTYLSCRFSHNTNKRSNVYQNLHWNSVTCTDNLPS